jgi:RNA polymerase sigma factor (sigma-70 family)
MMIIDDYFYQSIQNRTNMAKLVLTEKQDIVIVLAHCKACHTIEAIECDVKVYLAMCYLKPLEQIVRKFFILYSASYSTDEVLEICNVIFCKLFENQCALLKDYDPDKAGFYTFLQVISKSTVIDYLRYRTFRIMNELEDDPKSDYLSHYLEQKEKRKIVHESLQKIKSKKQQDVLELVLKDYDDSEIRDELNISKENVHTRKHRGIESLKKIIFNKLKKEDLTEKRGDSYEMYRFCYNG